MSGLSLPYDPSLDIEPPGTIRAVFFGLGSDGTVGANKNTIKILGAEENLNAQGYFVYDSKKSGSQTVSHLRFGPQPIRAPYLVQQASFVGCHHFGLLDRVDVLGLAAPGATLLLDCKLPADEVWDALPRPVQEKILAKRIEVYAIDAGHIAREAGLAGRTNTVLQTCFFAISGVLPREEAIAKIKAAIAKTYGRRGAEVVEKNLSAVDHTVAALHQIEVPGRVTSDRELPAMVPASAPEFVRTVTAMMMAGRGDELPVSMLPVDGTYPSGTTAYEKRNISELVAEWDPDLCIQCGNCSFVCPHSVIRATYYDESLLKEAPSDFKSAPLDARGLPDTRFTLQVYVEDCTGCELCVQACPVGAPDNPERKAINLAARAPLVAAERDNVAFFETLPVADRSRVDFGTVRGTQFLQPLFEFSGACAGCGETPYVKLLSQLFGDRLMVANATGCSSIYGGNLPTTPWTTNADGRGPAWSNSLFEDNAEFGLGFRLAADRHTELARSRLDELREAVGADLADEILGAPQLTEFQAWLAYAETGDHEGAWRQLVADNPMPAIHGRVCYHPCESVCNRASLDSAVSIHSVERFLGDLALERGWSFDPPPVPQRQAGAGHRRRAERAFRRLPPGPARPRGRDQGCGRAARRDDAVRHPGLPDATRRPGWRAGPDRRDGRADHPEATGWRTWTLSGARAASTRPSSPWARTCPSGSTSRPRTRDRSWTRCRSCAVSPRVSGR